MVSTLKNPIQSLLAQRRCLVLDGAMGTELERQGADVNDLLWSGRVLRDSPELVQCVHEAHVKAGADILVTASYQVGDDAVLLARSVQVARAACADSGRPVLVAASLGPYGACLGDGSEYSGDYGVSEATLEAFHRPRLKPLVEAGADLLAFETIPSLQEAKAIAAIIADDCFAEVPFWVSFSCLDRERVSSGDKFTECIRAVAFLENVVAVGVNCTAPQHVEALLRRGRGVTDKPLIAYPNGGGAWDSQHKQWTTGPNDRPLGDWAGIYFDAGARIIGGCCQTTPEDIQGIRMALEVAVGP